MKEIKNIFEDLLTMDELLALLKNQYSKYTVYRWVQKEGMPCRKIKGKLWFPKTLICQWLERSSEHATKIYKCALFPEIRGAQTLARKIANGDVFDKDKLRSIYRYHWSHIDTPDKLDQAIAVFEKHHWVHVESSQVKGAKSEIIRINPRLKRDGADALQNEGEQDV